MVIALTGFCLIAFLLKKQADTARIVSDKIVKDFKKVDEDFTRRNDSLHHLLMEKMDTSK